MTTAIRPATSRPHGIVVCAAAYLAGAIPFSNIAAKIRSGVDLRTVESGTVSGTALYRVAGFGPLVVAGICDVAKGAVGPLLAGPARPVVSATASAAAVAGHNWSPFLRGAGGRGISVAMGALAVRHPRGSALLLGSLAAGRITKQTALGSFVAQVAVVPLLMRAHGRRGAIAGLAVVAPMLAKRLTGNHPPTERSSAVYFERLLFDGDPPTRPTDYTITELVA